MDHTPAAASLSASPASKRRALIVFDFDKSLTEADCDEFVLTQLAPSIISALAENYTGPPPSWPAFFDELLGEVATKLPHVTRDDIIKTAALVPVSPRMLEAIRLAVDQHEATVVIVSDANQTYIHAMLDHHGLHDHVKEVYSNVSYWEEPGNRLRIKAYHPEDAEPHGCELCPTNMCKGLIVEELRGKDKYDVVMYVGDGLGDFCPSTRLTKSDVVFARSQKPNGKTYELMEKIQAHPDKVQARVVPWNTAEEIYDHFHQVLSTAQ